MILRPAKRRRSGEQVVERAAEAVDIGAMIDLVRVVPLFRRHVVECAEDLAGRGQLVRRRSLAKQSQAEVSQLHGEFSLEEDV